MKTIRRILRSFSERLERLIIPSSDNDMKNKYNYTSRSTGSEIRDRFEEFKQDTIEAYNKDQIGMLNMSRLSVQELIDLGYMHRKIESFLYAGEFENSEINRFFYDECKGIDGQVLGPIDLGPPEEKVFEFIDRLRFHTVKCKLWFEFVDFMSRMKEESIQRN